MMEELDVTEFDAVNGGAANSVDWDAVGATLALDGLAVGAVAASMPIAGFVAAAGAIGVISYGIYHEIR
ncbi:hypothetical protein ACJU26_03830 [Acidithiobacillus sp. M4-SHS-6]|uniref:hypothetical protein n=1 Tax=Acidithiobacillus sp. M4-SHS-6 TaxID=3383024 RepID=UPI0039BDEB70